MKLGFTCLWSNPLETTWSNTPWNLRSALSELVNVVDTGVQLPDYVRKCLKLLSIRYRNNRLTTNVNQSSFSDLVYKIVSTGEANKKEVDAVIEIGDVSLFMQPFYLYQDLSFDLLLNYKDLGYDIIGFKNLNKSDIQRRIDRQRKIYEKSNGIFTFSQWLADSLVKDTGMSKNKINVVSSGINAFHHYNLMKNIEKKRSKLLFVGVDFFRKGGDEVVKAFQKLRKQANPEITLTIAGPGKWPMNDEIPDGIEFLGRLSVEKIAQLYETHDLFVLPSRFEAFGIAFVEALAYGLPCIGRSICAMPEIIKPGYNGNLVNSFESNELADVIYSTLNDEIIYKNTILDSERIYNHYNWKRVASDMVSIINKDMAYK